MVLKMKWFIPLFLWLLITGCQSNKTPAAAVPPPEGETPAVGAVQAETNPNPTIAVHPSEGETAAAEAAQTESNTKPTFAIYLLDGEVRTAEAVQTDLAALPLQETPILTSSDIRWYDSQTHEMELTPAAYQRIQDIFPMPVRVDGIPFVVTAGEERIYAGAFWTPLSSLSFDGVVIMQPLAEDSSTIQIVLGYPGSDFFEDADPRPDKRVLDTLRAENKLRE